MTGYGTIYRFEFDGTCKPFPNQELLTTKCKVLILKKNYTGAINDIPNGQVSPVFIDYPVADDDIFYPIRGSVLSFKVLGGVINMDSIISEDEKEYFLEYYRDNELFWSGFVSPELCEEDIFLKYPEIEFKTIDGLGSLNTMQLSDTDGLRSFGKKTVKDIIAGIFRSIGFQYGFNILTKVWASGFDKLTNPLQQAYTYLNVYRDKDGNTFKSTDIIRSLAYLFNAVVYQDKGQWWFVKIKDLAFGENSANKYNSDGVVVGSSTIPTLQHGTDFLIIAEPKRKIRRFYKEASLNYQYYSSFENIDNNFTIWTNDDPILKVQIYQADYVNDNLEFNVLRSGTKQPEFEFYTLNGDVEVQSFYNPSNQDYGVMVYSDFGNTADYLQYAVASLKAGDTFTFNISSITRNQRLQIVIVGVSATRYYDIPNNTWGAGIHINTYGDSPTVYANNAVAPIDGLLYIRLLPNLLSPAPEPFQSFNYFTCYHGLYVSTSALKNNNQVTTVTNIKNTSIIPDQVTVYNGDFQDNPGGFDFTDYSNLKDQLNNDTKEWVERNEDEAYEIQELSTRNILNQYSDYRNIFTGTIIGKNLRFGAIYQFPVQGALADKLFFPLSMRLNERDCTADVVFMELTSNEIDGAVNQTIFDTNGNIVFQELSSSKKKIVMG